MSDVTGVDLSGELHDLAAAVGDIEDQLSTTAEQLELANRTIDELNLAIEQLQEQVIWSESDAEVFELLSDYKRGLIDRDELLDRTVGR